MKLKERLGMKGRITIIKNGEVVVKQNNLIVNTGLAEMAGLLLTDTSGSVTTYDYIGIGTGTTTATATDTTLETESMREQGTGTRTTTTVTNDTAHLEATFNITSTLAITESGMFNAASSGVMLNRTTFSAVNLNNGDVVVVKWDISFASA